MSQYNAPLRDTRFATEEVLDFGGHLALIDPEGDINLELLASVVEEAGKFAENEVAPFIALVTFMAANLKTVR